MVAVTNINVMRLIETERGEHGITLNLAAQEGQHALFIPSRSVGPIVDALQKLDGPEDIRSVRTFSAIGHGAARSQEGATCLQIHTHQGGSFAFIFPPEALDGLIDALTMLRDGKIPPFNPQ